MVDWEIARILSVLHCLRSPFTSPSCSPDREGRGGVWERRVPQCASCRLGMRIPMGGRPKVRRGRTPLWSILVDLGKRSRSSTPTLSELPARRHARLGGGVDENLKGPRRPRGDLAAGGDRRPGSGRGQRDRGTGDVKGAPLVEGVVRRGRGVRGSGGG